MKNLFLILVMLTLNFTDKTVHSDGHVEIVWETEKIFELPESVIYDSTNDVLYVSNITDHPFKKMVLVIFQKLVSMEILLKKNGSTN